MCVLFDWEMGDGREGEGYTGCPPRPSMPKLLPPQLYPTIKKENSCARNHASVLTFLAGCPPPPPCCCPYACFGVSSGLRAEVVCCVPSYCFANTRFNSAKLSFVIDDCKKLTYSTVRLKTVALSAVANVGTILLKSSAALEISCRRCLSFLLCAFRGASFFTFGLRPFVGDEPPPGLVPNPRLSGDESPPGIPRLGISCAVPIVPSDGDTPPNVNAGPPPPTPPPADTTDSCGGPCPIPVGPPGTPPPTPPPNVLSSKLPADPAPVRVCSVHLSKMEASDSVLNGFCSMSSTPNDR